MKAITILVLLAILLPSCAPITPPKIGEVRDRRERFHEQRDRYLHERQAPPKKCRSRACARL